MYKKILLVSAFALGLSSAALADGEDVNFNFNHSIYFGGQATYSNLHYGSNSYTLWRDSIESRKWGGRGYLGFSFNEFIAAELGYDYLGRPKIIDHVTSNTQDFLQQGIDLVGKATLPLDYGFGVFIKAGGMWVYRSAVASRAGCFADKDSNGKLTAIGGLGVSYNFVPNIGIDLSYTRSFAVGDLPTMDIFAVGLSYKINM